MVATEFPIITDFKFQHRLKAMYPIVVTEFGMIMEARLMQLENVLSSIAVMPSGIFAETIALHPSKASAPIELTVAGMSMDSSL